MEEILYGGAAGGGKTDALLMGALQYVHVPGYNALVLMRTFADLSLPKAGMDRAMEWLSGTDARPVEGGKAWHFPSGATLTFGYLQSAGDEQRYRTAEFSYIAFDELTRFPEQAYRFLFTRLRPMEGGPLSRVPMRMRCATNPGGKYGEWVKGRFVPDEYLRQKGEGRFGRVWWTRDEDGTRLLVPARLKDNPTIDEARYRRMLAKLLPVERAQQEDGDWAAHADGHFKRVWFRSFRDIGDAYLLHPGGEVVRKAECYVVCAGDFAGGESESADYTCYVFAAVTPAGQVLILDVVRERIAVEHVVGRLAEACLLWRPLWCALEDGFLQSAYIREAGRTFGVPQVRRMDPGRVGSKLVRATPAVLAAENGKLYLPEERRPWLEAFLAELCSFTGDDTRDAHDDQVDALAWLVIALDRMGGAAHGEPLLAFGRRRGQ